MTGTNLAWILKCFRKVFVASELNKAMCPSCGRDIDPGTEDLGPQFTAMQCGRCGDSWRWADAGADAFSLVLARCVGSMTPVEDQYSLEGRRRAARFNLCLAVWYRVDGDPAWRRGMTANLSRSGVLFRASGVGAFFPQRCTDPHCPSEIVIEVSKGAISCQVHCHATVARVVDPSPGDELGAIAVTVGDYILLAH